MIGALFSGIVEEEGGTEQNVGVAVGALAQDFGNGGCILQGGDVGPALAPVFGELIEVALIDVVNDLVEVEVVPTQYVRHGVRVDHGADLVVDAFRGQRFNIPIEVEVIAEPQGQQVGGVVIRAGLDVGQSDGDLDLLVIGLAARVELVHRCKERLALGAFDFQMGLVLYGQRTGNAQNQRHEDQQERLHFFHGITSFYFVIRNASNEQFF